MTNKVSWFCTCSQSPGNPEECVQNKCITRERVNELAKEVGLPSPFASKANTQDLKTKKWLASKGLSTKQIGRRGYV